MRKLLYITSGLLLPFSAFAQKEIPRDVLDGGPQDIVDLLKDIIGWAYTIFLTLAVLFILMAAYRYLTSGGGDGVQKAHKMLVWAVVSIVVAFLANGIVILVETLLQ